MRSNPKGVISIFPPIEKPRLLSAALIFGLLAMMMGLTGCGYSSTTTSTSSGGSGSGGTTTSDATLIANQLAAFKTAVEAADSTTLKGLVSSSFTGKQVTGDSLSSRDALVTYITTGFPPRNSSGSILSSGTVNGWTQPLGTPTISSDSTTATIVATLEVGVSTPEVAIGGGRTLTKNNNTFKFNGITISLAKESGTWKITAMDLSNCGLMQTNLASSAMFGLNIVTFTNGKLSTSSSSSNKPTMSSTTESSMAQHVLGFAGVGWVDDASSPPAPFPTNKTFTITLSGLKDTSGNSYSISHKVNLN